MSGAQFDFSEVVALADLFSKAGREALVKATAQLEEVARSTAAAARADAPVDTGELRDSIRVEGSGPYTRLIISNIEHSLYVEFGTSKMSPQAYLIPQAPQAERALIRGLSEIIPFE